MAQRWYVLRVKKPSDAVACSDALQMMGLEAFAPVERTAEKGALYGPTRWHIAERQTMPGYVFAKLDLPSDGWAASVRYVDHILPKGRDPVLPPQDAVERARAAHEANSLLTLPDLLRQERRRQRREKLAPGSIMRIVEGPFAGWSMRVERDTGAAKVPGTLLDGDGRDFAPVSIPAAWLEPGYQVEEAA
jgi:transcription antitermination factor NusG